MHYNTVLFDLDDTLIDFSATEFAALKDAMEKNGLSLSREDFEAYRLINSELWRNFEKGYYTKKEVLSLRFDLLFAQNGLFGDSAQVNHDYLKAMGEHAILLDGAMELLETLDGKVQMALVTNGAEMAQKLKLEKTGLDKYFKEIYISDVEGFNKPDRRFFEVVEEAMGGFDKEKTLIIGDGLGSDIKGGIQYGIATCWFNPGGMENTTEWQPDYEIDALGGVLMVLGLV